MAAAATSGMEYGGILTFFFVVLFLSLVSNGISREKGGPLAVADAQITYRLRATNFHIFFPFAVMCH